MKTRLMANVLVIAMAVSFASAQEVTSIGRQSKALLFTFNGLNNLGAGSYAGGVGAKYFLTDVTALRGGLQFASTNTSTPSNVTGGTDGSNSALTYGLNAGLEYHLTANRVSPYVGGMLDVSSTTTEVKSVVNVAGGQQTTTKNAGTSDAGLSLGLGGIAGVEFFLTKEISLAAEYQLGYGLTSHYDQTATTGATTITTKEGSTSTIAISNTGGLTLSVYF